MSNLKVLALMPHPDDVEILCAGTLIRLKEAGCEVHIATMTAGDKGSVELRAKVIADIRREEARQAAAALGAAGYTCLEFDDLEIVFDNESRKRVCSLLRNVRPEIVFTTPPADYMFDHEITSQLVRDACFNASVKNYVAEQDCPPLTAIPHLYYSDPIGGCNMFGEDCTPHFLIDISGQIDQKSRALECHKSQREWLQKQHGIDDYVESMRRWAGSRGALAGAAFAEGFRQHLGHPHPTDNPLVAMLGAAYIHAQ